MEELEKLYQSLTRDGYYTKSFEEFQKQSQDPEYQKKVFDVVSRDGLFTKSQEEFTNKYFPNVSSQGVEPVGKPVASESASASESGSSLSGLPTETSKPTPQAEVKQEDVFIMSPQQASTAPIGDVKKSIDAARKFYGADLNQALVKEGVVIPSKRSQEFNELVDIYNSKIINGEGTSNDRYELAQTKTANEYISSLLDQGIVTEEEVKDLTSLNEIYKLVAEKKSMAEGVGAWADAPRAFGTEIQAPQGKDYIVNSIIKEQNKEYYDLLAKNILETIPPEQRTTDNLERIEQELFEENDLIVDLTGEGRVGEGQNAFKNFALKTQKGLEDVAMTIGAYKSAVDPSMWMTGKPIGALGIDYANKFRKEELDRLEKKITQYDSNMTELLSKGNYMGAIDLGLQTTGESVAPMAVAAAVSFATGNPYAGYAAISAYSGGQRYLDVKDEPWFQALNPWGKLAYNTVYGTSEGLTEAVGARIAGRLVKGLLIGDDAANRGLREYLKEFAKIQGLNVIEEVPAEVVTGITQMISEKVAKGEEITMKDINETAIESGLGALFMTGAIGSLGTLKIPIAAANSLKVKKANKAAKETIDDINNAQTPQEKTILAEKLMQIEDVRNSLISSEGERLKQFSEEDLNTYTEKVAEFNRLQSQLEGLPEGSKAAEVIQERMQNVVNDITAINDKYEQAQQPKEQTDAIQEQETDEVSLREQASVGSEVGEEVRSTEEEKRGTPEGEVQEEVTTDETVEESVEGQPKSPTPQKILGTPKPDTKPFTTKKLYQLAESDQSKQRRADVKEQAAVSSKVGDFIRETLKFATRKIPARQVKALVDRARKLNFGRPATVQRFVDYANKVMEDSEYFAKVELADKLTSRLKRLRKSKNTPANQKALIDRLLELNPRDVNVDTFNEVAQGLVDASTRVRVKPNLSVTPEGRMDNASANEAINTLTQEAQDTKIERVATANDISFDEAKDMINSSKDIVSNAEQEINRLVEDEGLSYEDAAQKYYDEQLEKRNVRRKILEDYVAQQIDTIPEGSPIEYMKGIDLSKLPSGLLAQLEMVVDNYMKNGVVYGDYTFQALADAQNRIKRVDESDIKERVKKPATTFRNLIQFVDRVLGGQKKTGEFLADIGYTVFQQARKTVMDSENYFRNRLKTAIDKYRSQGTASIENNVRRQVYSIALQLQDYADRTGASMDTLFQAFYNNLKTSLDSLANQGMEKTAQYKALEKMIAEMEGATSIDDIQISEGDKEVIREVQGLHKEVEGELAEFTRRAKNRDMPIFPEYLSIQIRGKQTSEYDQEISAKMSFLDFMLGRNLFPKKSGTLKERGTFVVLKPGEYYDLNFNNVQQSAYFNNLFEARVSLPLSVISKVLDSKNLQDKTSIPFARQVKEYIAAEKDQTFARGQSFFPNGWLFKNSIALAFGMKRLSSLALFGAPVFQLIKQPVVAINTFFKAFRDFGFSGVASVANLANFVKDYKQAKGFIDATTTGSRDVQDEILRMNSPAQEKIERYLQSKASGLRRAGQLGEQFLNLKEKVLLSGLKYSDKFASIFTVLSLYRAYLADKGIKVEDWNKELELIAKKDPTRERALSYAETNMKVDHNINVREEVAPIFRAETDPQKKWDNFRATIFEGLIAPFSRFIINKKVTIYNDVAKLGDKETFKDGAIAMAGHASEMALFGYMQVYVIPALQSEIGDLLWGDDDDDDRNILKDNIYEDEKKRQKFWTNFTTDFLPVVTDFETKIAHDGLNYIYFLNQYIQDSSQFDDLKGEGVKEKFFSWYRLREQPLYKYYGESDMSTPFSIKDLGSFTIAPSIIMDGLDLINMKEGEYTDAYGNKRYVSKDDARKMRVMGFIQVMGGAGYMFGEMTFSSKRKEYDIKKYDAYYSKIERALKDEDYDVQSAWEENIADYGALPGIAKSEYEFNAAVKSMYDRQQEFFSRVGSISETEDEFFRKIKQRYDKIPDDKKQDFVNATIKYVILNKSNYIGGLGDITDDEGE